MNDYLDRRSLRHHSVLPQLFLALIETTRKEGPQDEYVLLGSLSYHLGGLARLAARMHETMPLSR